MRSMDDPLALFEAWLEEARAELGYDADAMAVATATADGAPSARMVLLKGVDERGLVFFTNYSSRKGVELEQNPRAALLFHWQPLGRQVRIEGPVSRVDRSEGEAYARSRPRQSQLSALASPQSRWFPTANGSSAAWRSWTASTRGATCPSASDWGGYRVEPESWEFWQHATTASTTATATPAPRTAGWSSGSRPRARPPAPPSP